MFIKYECFIIETNVRVKGENDMMKRLIDEQITRFDLHFSDGQRVVLNKLIDYDIDLYKSEKSAIAITTCPNFELFNRFCNNIDNIVKIQFTIEDKEVIDIVCNMNIGNLMLNGSIETASEMRVVLEGMVK